MIDLVELRSLILKVVTIANYEIYGHKYIKQIKENSIFSNTNSERKLDQII